MKFPKRIPWFGWCIFFTLIYCFLPTKNSTLDAWGYAADAKWGNDLFASHHLLYTAFLHFVGRLLENFGLTIDYLLLGKTLNGLFAGGSLFVLGLILKQLHFENNKRGVYLFFVGSSFAIFRFATENETYIVPIFFSMVGTWCWMLFLDKKSLLRILFTGFFLAFACLWHQIHFFWWLAFLIYVLIAFPRYFISFAAPAGIVPLAYIGICFILKGQCDLDTLQRFVFDNFYSGTAKITFSPMGAARWIVNMLRTFFQLHGETWWLVKKWPWLLGIVFGGLVGSFLLFIYLRKVKSNEKPYTIYEVAIPVALALVLHLVWAFLSMGNSEFMVMIPFLVAILMCQIRWIPTHVIAALSFFMFFWNLALATIPSAFVDFYGDEKWNFMIQKHVKNEICYMERYGELGNRSYYSTGKLSSYIKDSNPLKRDMKKEIENYMQKGYKINTNWLNEGGVINTDRVLNGKKQVELFSTFGFHKVDSVETFFGKSYLFQLELNKKWK